MTDIRTRLARLALGAGFVVLAGCGPRAHLGPEHGEATHAWRARQRVNPQPATGKVGGLDSEEAALIHARYRESMGGNSKAEPASRVMIVEEDRGGGRGKPNRSTK